MQDHYQIGFKVLRRPLYFPEKGKLVSFNSDLGQESIFKMQPLAMFKQA